MTRELLQTVIDRSLAGAKPLAKSLFGGSPWDAEHVENFVNAVGGMTVATGNRHGVPHAAVVIAGSHDGSIHFAVSTDLVDDGTIGID